MSERMILVPVFLRVPVPEEGSSADMVRAAVELVENCGVSIEGQRVPVTVIRSAVDQVSGFDQEEDES